MDILERITNKFIINDCHYAYGFDSIYFTYKEPNAITNECISVILFILFIWINRIYFTFFYEWFNWFFVCLFVCLLCYFGLISDFLLNSIFIHYLTRHWLEVWLLSYNKYHDQIITKTRTRPSLALNTRIRKME